MGPLRTRGRGRSTGWVLLASLLATACGQAAGGGPANSGGGQLMISPQNSTLLVGIDRISIALFDESNHPISGARATLDIQGGGGSFETRPLEYIGPEYGNIPIYVGTARLPQEGQYKYVVNAALPDGSKRSGQAIIDVKTSAPELTVGARVPPLTQPIITDPGVKVTDIDSGVPPDDWHSATIAAGLAQHRPMLLYFGEPGFCKSKTCGPTVQILQKSCATYCDRILFEHIEDHYPAGPDETSKDNPAFKAFGLQTDPWVYLVNSKGVISDRFEGPVTVAELASAAEGTLQGKVPAVDIALGG